MILALSVIRRDLDVAELSGPVRPVATNFHSLLARGSTMGFVDLVRPENLRDRLAEERVLSQIESEGRCARCGGRTTGGYRCDDCREDHNASVQESRAARRQSGVCIFCGKPACSCPAKGNSRVNALRKRRRRNGLCELCGLQAVRGGYCAEHRAKRLPKARDRMAARRAANKAANLCASCGKEAPVNGGETCESCRKRSRDRKRSKRLLGGSADSVETDEPIEVPEPS